MVVGGGGTEGGKGWATSRACFWPWKPCSFWKISSPLLSTDAKHKTSPCTPQTSIHPQAFWDQSYTDRGRHTYTQWLEHTESHARASTHGRHVVGCIRHRHTCTVLHTHSMKSGCHESIPYPLCRPIPIFARSCTKRKCRKCIIEAVLNQIQILLEHCCIWSCWWWRSDDQINTNLFVTTVV